MKQTLIRQPSAIFSRMNPAINTLEQMSSTWGLWTTSGPRQSARESTSSS